MKHTFTLITALLLAPLAALHATAAPAKPNIVVIVADDLGYADVLFNPQHPKEVTTPHLDALAKEGVVCRQGYVTGHVCSPTRAGLMTGRYQQRLGLYTGGEAGSGKVMVGELGGLAKRPRLTPMYTMAGMSLGSSSATSRSRA